MSKSLKETITEVVLAQLPESLHNEKNTTVDKLLFRWWMTGRQDGLRLTDIGDLAFRTADIEYYQYELKLQPETQYHAYILELNKKIKCPYYMGVNKDGKKAFPYIRFYDSKIAMMISLYGNVNEYLDSIKVNK
jgi:hypothetical protein